MKEITFKTKFDLGQSIVKFDASRNKLIPFVVTKISFDCSKDGVSIWYHGETLMASENDCYSSREDFIAQL